MADSNQFHAVCMDTYPPVFYLNDISKGIIRFVNAYNSKYLSESNNVDGFGKMGYRAAYTFDAGPNAVIYILKQHVDDFLSCLNQVFPMSSQPLSKTQIDNSNMGIKMASFPIDSISRIIHTRVGDGPRILARGYDSNVSLLSKDGNYIPKI